MILQFWAYHNLGLTYLQKITANVRLRILTQWHTVLLVVQYLQGTRLYCQFLVLAS